MSKSARRAPLAPDLKQDIRRKLDEAGLRPTRQRLELAAILFGAGHRHVTAEQLLAEAVKEGVSVSNATIYNTINQFTEAGLLRQVALDGSKTYFDTNTAAHHHFYAEDEGMLMDIPPGQMLVTGVPEAPPGTEVAGVDVIVRLARKDRR